MIASIRSALARIRAFANKPVRDTDLDQELASHLDFAIEENLRRGLSPEEARRQALIRFGGVEQSREQQRAARGLPALDILLQDLRYTLRTLRRDRGFTFIAILILAIGIGANIAVFSVVNTLMLRPLPFRDPARLLWIGPEILPATGPRPPILLTPIRNSASATSPTRTSPATMPSPPATTSSSPATAIPGPSPALVSLLISSRCSAWIH
jgi:hypothetical protein